MLQHDACILVLNGGSSSIKFALYSGTTQLQERLRGSIETRSTGSAQIVVRRNSGEKETVTVSVHDRNSIHAQLIEWIGQQVDVATIRAAGHRIVHGMRHSAPERVTPELMHDLHANIPCDPDHLPGQIALIEALQQRLPQLQQFACFDTAFHANMPRVAQLTSLPRRYEAQGVKRYGFHGLSYAYIVSELMRLGDPAATGGRVIFAHLGGGASLCAVRNGQSIDTTMGFTPSSGLLMGTRAGDIDPSLPGFLQRAEGMPATRFDEMMQHESGLLGVSETSADMRELMSREASDTRAAEAVSLFCYQARKYVGAYAAALGGVDTLVFSGGVGEHAPSIRARICEGMEFLGIVLDADRNTQSADIISTDASTVTVRVVHTNEELMIARSVVAMSVSTS